MENASKALIIAGAILLSILIIALGIYVFNMSKSASNTNALSKMEISEFNGTFTNYEGKQTGSTVKGLIDEMISSAIANQDADDKLPTLEYKNFPNENNNNVESKVGAGNINTNGMKEVKNKISNSHYYNVKTEINPTTGLVNRVIIDYETSGSGTEK